MCSTACRTTRRRSRCPTKRSVPAFSASAPWDWRFSRCGLGPPASAASTKTLAGAPNGCSAFCAWPRSPGSPTSPDSPSNGSWPIGRSWPRACCVITGSALPTSPCPWRSRSARQRCWWNHAVRTAKWATAFVSLAAVAVGGHLVALVVDRWQRPWPPAVAPHGRLCLLALGLRVDSRQCPSGRGLRYPAASLLVQVVRQPRRRRQLERHPAKRCWVG